MNETRKPASSIPMEERIDAILRGLRTSLSDLEAAAVASADGLVIASSLQPSADERGMVALAASSVILGDAGSQLLKLGGLNQILVKNGRGYLLTLRVGREALLTLQAGPRARLGLLLLKAKQAASQIEQCL